MIIINALFYIKPEKEAQFLEDIAPLIASSRQEEGNVSYGLYQGTEEKDTYLMVEKWADQAAIEKHNENPLLKKFAQEIGVYSYKAPQLTIAQAKE